MKSNYICLLLIMFIIGSCTGTAEPEQNKSSSKIPTQKIEYKEYGFSISFPSDWKRVESDKALYISRDSCSGEYCANSILTVIPKDEKFDLNLYAEAFLQNMQSSSSQFKVVNIKDTLIDELNTKIIDYKMEMQDIHLGGTEALVELPNHIISIDCTGSNFPARSYVKIRPYFMEIIESIRKI